MPFVTTPDGDTFEETNPVALDYYRRDPDFTVRDEPDADPPAKAPRKPRGSRKRAAKSSTAASAPVAPTPDDTTGGE